MILRKARALEWVQQSQMKSVTRETDATAVPKKRQRHHAYNESADEPPKLIETEAVELEAEAPAEENEPVEQVGRDESPGTPAFEDG